MVWNRGLERYVSSFQWFGIEGSCCGSAFEQGDVGGYEGVVPTSCVVCTTYITAHSLVIIPY